MRDLERWKDKIELSLDGRQIFFLFFGSAVVVCLIFVSGVLVGKRLEARALALEPAPIDDPLAALDQLGEAREDLTFQQALTREERPRHSEPAKPEPTPPKSPQIVATAPPAKKSDAGKKPEAGGHFTLQLSAFPERSEAEEFMHKIEAAGYRPFVVASEIPGKGVFYRVRVGDFTSRQSALAAKNEFERKQRMIAYVAKL